MGIISTIKSVLGLEEREAKETRVAVEREPEAASERAVTETEPETGVEETDEGVETGDGSGAEPSHEGEAEPATERTESAEGSTEETTVDESVEEIKGIGPAYAGRLAQAGVENVADLAEADAAQLAEETDLSETRIQGWIERAQSRWPGGSQDG
ncbi:MAG: helix-hairpin-helix domain-containing protein [Halanaeroarchaeum sp.]